MKRILIVEDDASILRLLIDTLKTERFDITTASDGEAGYKIARQKKFDLIILDVMLPSMDGFEICKNLRNNNIASPILMLTAKGEEVDKVIGLEIGADDYMTKPFGVRELIARVHALLRRQTEIHSKIEETTIGDLYVNFKQQEVCKGKKTISMRAKEFQLLRYFVEREGEVISRSQLLDDVWGYEVTPTTRTVDNYILSIRKKIETDPAHPIHLLTIHTVGYKFVK
ncbi:MAG: response regulator transcription factor [Bacteroidota bacterium]